MKVKKILKIVGLVILILLVVFGIDLMRKTIIISKIEKNVQYYDSTTNYYEKRKSNEGIELEIMRKDNIVMVKQYKENRTMIVYKDISNNIGYAMFTEIDENGKEVKTAIKYNNADNIMLPDSSERLIGRDDFWTCMRLAIRRSVTTEKANGEECYKIMDNMLEAYYFSKDTLLIKKITAGNIETDFIEYTLNTVTDEDIKLPDLSEYEIREQ